jgi:hypothetical protein
MAQFLRSQGESSCFSVASIYSFNMFAHVLRDHYVWSHSCFIQCGDPAYIDLLRKLWSYHFAVHPRISLKYEDPPCPLA